MRILVATVNTGIIDKIIGKGNYKPATKNTCTRFLKNATFEKLYQGLKDEGYNPFAIMSW